MEQKRNPPAFQEYAASMLASRQFRLMNLSERGLFYTVRLECWENKNVPALIEELSVYLGVPHEEVKLALTERVKSFLLETNGSFSCPEIENYRNHLAARRLKQSDGGKKGAAKTNSLKKSLVDEDFKINDSTSYPHTRRDSLVKLSKVKTSQKQSVEKDDVLDDWLSDYQNQEDKDDI